MPASDERFLISLRCAGTADGALTPTAFRIVEEISTPYEITIDVTRGDDVDASSLLRQGVEIDVETADGSFVRRFEGMVTRVTERFRGGETELTLHVSSPLAILALSSDCRIFQALAAPDIVTNVLASCGVSNVTRKLSGTYAMRDSCTQYNETMLAFVSRLLEDEGIFYFFEETANGLGITLADAATAHPQISPEVPFSADGGVLGLRALTRIVDVATLRPGKVTLRDLDWQKPALSLEATVSDKLTSREHYDYPGGYIVAAEGKRRAQNLLDAFTSEAAKIRATSTVAEMSAGYIFTLKGSVAHDDDWRVVRVVHTWRSTSSADGESGYTNEIVATKKSAAYRPLQKTPRPRIVGPQTAIVTGPAGQEINTDASGRVKLKFPWDRRAKFDDTSSAWVRVAENALTGSMHVPRIGWEVLVEFLHGDPDKPVVVARLFNATYVPPYALPANKTRSAFATYSSPGGKGHNEIRLEDAAGSEHVHVHAQKDYTLTTAGARTTAVTTSTMTTIKTDQSVTVKKSDTIAVQGMWDVTVAGKQTLSVTKDRKKTVKKDEMVTIVGDRKTTIDGDHELTLSANDTLQTGGDYTINVTGDFDEEANDAIRIATADDAETTVSAAKTEIAKTGKSTTIGGKLTRTIGGAASVTSEQDFAVRVAGKRTSTIGAAFSATSGADIEISSGDTLEITTGAALSFTASASITFKVGSSKVTIGSGGVVVDAAKVKITSDGPLIEAGALVLSK